MAWSIVFLASLFLFFVVEFAIFSCGLWHGEAGRLVRLLRISAIAICIGLLPVLLSRLSLVSGGHGAFLGVLDNPGIYSCGSEL
jgi:hypothetical protein